MAFLIACQQLGVDAARNILDLLRHIPNSRVVRLRAERLKMPEIEHALNERRNEHANTVSSDYYDEIDWLEASGVVNRVVVA